MSVDMLCRMTYLLNTMTNTTTPADIRALSALRAEPNGIHFQLCPFANQTLYALVSAGLVAIGSDLYARLTDAGWAVSL